LNLANSEKLHKNWQVLNTNYADTTKALGEYLFLSLHTLVYILLVRGSMGLSLFS